MLKIILSTLLFIAPQLTAEWLDLWTGQAPGPARGPAGTEQMTEKQHLTNIEVPQYQIFRPENPNGTGVVVFPGGGYTILALDHEGIQAGQWLAEQGITAMVVKYRVGSDPRLQYEFPIPQLDARRAIRTMRSKASDWNLEEKKIGVLGFSAGGHLAASCAVQFEEIFQSETKDKIDAFDARPDFAILCYPVAIMGGESGHRGSQDRLLGKNPDPKLVSLNNIPERITSDTPPIFLIHSADDDAVPLRNSCEIAARCAEKGVPVRAHFYETGGHGYGIKGRGTAVGWNTELAKWLDLLNETPRP